jgi:probable F420-dependent oxidoreductase
MPGGFSFAVQAVPTTGEEWLAIARDVEARGFTTLCVSDHPGTTLSPFVALGAAAATTTSLRLGTAVVNVGVRHPFDVAADAASLARISPGGVELGVGAGHTPSEWAAIGRDHPPAAERVERLVEAIPIIRRLLAGERVDHEGTHFQLRDARLEFAPSHEVPLLVGGNRALARATAAQVDAFEFSGLGRTLPDGHFHEPRWSTADIDALVAAFQDGVGSPTPQRTPELGALIQMVAVTDDADRVARAFLDDIEARVPPGTALPTVDDLLAAPFVLIGTVAEIVEQLWAARARWGFTRYTVRAGTLDAMTDVLRVLGEREALAPTSP